MEHKYSQKDLDRILEDLGYKEFGLQWQKNIKNGVGLDFGYGISYLEIYVRVLSDHQRWLRLILSRFKLPGMIDLKLYDENALKTEIKNLEKLVLKQTREFRKIVSNYKASMKPYDASYVYF